MIFSLYKRVFIVCIFSIVGACTHLEEGEIDYAKTTTDNNSDILRLSPKYTHSNAISEGDTISVHLAGGFSHDLPEIRSFIEFMTRNWKLRWPAANAEIAIIANICEQGVNGCGTEFGPNALEEGRVVYFSDSVKAKQMLNFSYLPVYGPITYQGNPLIIQLAIVELDIPNEQQKNLIKKLAEIGGKSYPPASKLLQAMDSVGSSLLQGNHHDIAFRYDMTLMPGGGINDIQYPRLSAGNYVFVRKDRIAGEQEKLLWDNLKIDPKTGRLLAVRDANKKCPPCIQHKFNENKHWKSYESYEEYRENTYLVLQIQSGFQKSSLDNQQTLAVLTEEIAKKNSEDTTEIDKLLEETGNKLSRQNRFDDIRAYVYSLKNELGTKATQREKDLQAVAAQKTWDSILVETQRYEKCHDAEIPQTDECKDALLKDQLTQIAIELRSIIATKDTENANNVDTIYPLTGINPKSKSLNTQRQVFINSVTKTGN